MNDVCANSKTGKHYFLNQPILRADFEPTQYGATAEETLYKRVEYTIGMCSCGVSRKTKIKLGDE